EWWDVATLVAFVGVLLVIWEWWNSTVLVALVDVLLVELKTYAALVPTEMHLL
ncbi:hypothetical protein HAX54_016437, partial [Datura stramonium]|nr:hypothetical protein [Datura stramonium]